jgi:hypothetical protein
MYIYYTYYIYTYTMKCLSTVSEGTKEREGTDECRIVIVAGKLYRCQIYWEHNK